MSKQSLHKLTLCLSLCSIFLLNEKKYSEKLKFLIDI